MEASKGKSQGYMSKVMVIFLSRANEWTVVPSVTMGGALSLACRKVKFNLENTEFEQLRGLKLRGALWLKEKWQTKGEAKLQVHPLTIIQTYKEEAWE